MIVKKGIVLFLIGAGLLLAACEEEKEQKSELQVTETPAAPNPEWVLPKAQGVINDFENVFTAKERISIDSLLKAFEKETTIEIAVVTLDSTTILPNDMNLSETTLALAEAWGVGKKDKNNGMLVGISVFRGQMFIQNGRGIERVFSDEQTKLLIDSVFIPHYANDEYFIGTMEGLKAIMAHLRKNKP